MLQLQFDTNFTRERVLELSHYSKELPNLFNTNLLTWKKAALPKQTFGLDRPSFENA